MESIYLGRSTIACGIAVLLAADICAPPSLAMWCSASFGGQAARGSSSSPLHARGLEYGYNLDYPQALSAFEEAIAADPQDATAHRLAAATLWMRMLFEQGAVTVEDYLGQARPTVRRHPPSAELAGRFRAHLDRAIAIAEQKVRTNPTDADAHFQLGAAFALRASYIATIDGRVAGSLMTARRAYTAHKRCLVLDPQRKDAALVVGMYRYIVASLPMHQRLFARIAGFESGRESGLRLVEDAAAYPGNAQTNARLTLMLMYNREGRHADALRIIRQLQQKYPRNRLLWLEAGGTALRAGRPAEALQSYDEGLAQLAADTRPKASGEEARWRLQRDAARAALGHETTSRDARRSTFDSDIRNLVYRWDRKDPRSPEERHAALFAFVHQTYDTSAWIPQSVFDGNLVTQAIVGHVDTIISDKVGLVPWRENKIIPAYGMAPSLKAGAPLSWTVNCLVCHTAEIDGVAYFGAGTKVFDDLWLGESLKMLTNERWRAVLARDPASRAMAADANRILNSHHHDKIDSLTRARSTAFAASHVELYLRPHNNTMPRSEDVGRGDVKTPPLWHTAAKMPAGRWYSDGSFHGRIPLMASSMELEKDRPFDALVEHVIPAIKEEFDSVIRHLRPPPYPYAIDRDLAEQGRQLFYSMRVGCSQCHGRYDGQGNVDWPGIHADVGTDRARLAVVSDGFIEAFNSSPIAAEGALVKSHGYAATPLTGVWANYPYLHNGSVPTLYHLLGPASERPRIFHVMAARRFDRERVGQLLYEGRANDRVGELELFQKFGSSRDWFNTARPGSGNGGHDFWSRIRTDRNRRALIEYLKTL